MIKGIESIILFSENAKGLANFYKGKVGLKVTAEFSMGEKNAEIYGFEMGQGSPLYIVDHSGVKGKSKQPKRIMFNLEVDKIEEEVKRLTKAGVKMIQDVYHVQDYGKIATFEDVDGNYFQLVQTHAN